MLRLAKNAELAITHDTIGHITGYAALRRFGLSWFLGPIISPSFEDRQKLIYHLAAPLAVQFMRIDVDPVLGLSRWLTEIGPKRTDYGTKMRKNLKQMFGQLWEFAVKHMDNFCWLFLALYGKQI